MDKNADVRLCASCAAKRSLEPKCARCGGPFATHVPHHCPEQPSPASELREAYEALGRATVERIEANDDDTLNGGASIGMERAYAAFKALRAKER